MPNPACYPAPDKLEEAREGSMVVLNRIYTKTGDDGTTALGSGARVAKHHLRIQSYGTVDETNSVIGVARLNTREPALKTVDDMLGRIQNDLFDLGADLCVPDTGEPLAWMPLRVSPEQVTRLESEIDTLNGELEPLRSFVLPGGHPAAAQLHVARTVCRRAERLMTELALLPGETVSAAAAQYVNRLSDFLFVASRYINARTGVGDVLWVPGKTRTGG
jgi:cob(I)alamin adenosyltransferase